MAFDKIAFVTKLHRTKQLLLARPYEKPCNLLMAFNIYAIVSIIYIVLRRLVAF